MQMLSIGEIREHIEDIWVQVWENKLVNDLEIKIFIAKL